MNESIKLLAINSSPRKNTTVDLLEDFIKSAKTQAAEVERIDLYQYKHEIPFEDGELTYDKRLTPLQQKMVDSDGFVIATPTYWFNHPAILKAFIDHLTVLEHNQPKSLLEGKVAGFIAYAPEGGEANVLQNLALTFNHFGVLLPPYSLLYYRGPKDTWAIKDINLLAKRIIQQIRIQKQNDIKWSWNF